MLFCASVQKLLDVEFLKCLEIEKAPSFRDEPVLAVCFLQMVKKTGFLLFFCCILR